MVEPTPQWNRTLTATQQWEQARGSWRAMVEEWKRQAARTGVTGPGMQTNHRLISFINMGEREGLIL